MHIWGKHQEQSTKTRLKHMFDHRSKAQPPSIPDQNPGQAKPDVNNSDVEMLPPSDSTSMSTLDFCSLIPTEVADGEGSVAGTNSAISLQDLFNFDNCHWTNIHEEYAKRHLADELEVCELLNKDAATENGVEVDVNEMTGNILMG